MNEEREATIGKIETGANTRHELLAAPTPLGPLGLTIGCAALTPIAFGRRLKPAGTDLFELAALKKDQFA